MTNRFIALALLLVLAAPAVAQSDNAIAGALGVTLTPTGNAASITPNALAQEQQRAFGFTYGRRNDIVNAYSIAADLGPLRLQAGVANFVDDDDEAYMLGVGYGRTLWRSASDAQITSVGLAGEFGFGRIESVSAYSFGLKVPLAVTMSGTGYAITPYVAPGGFFGGITADGENESGVRATANAGVQFALPLARLEVGAHKIFIDDSEITWGVGLSFSWR